MQAHTFTPSLLVSYREEVQDHLHEIYFLPDHPELKDIHAVLDEYKKVWHPDDDGLMMMIMMIMMMMMMMMMIMV